MRDHQFRGQRCHQPVAFERGFARGVAHGCGKGREQEQSARVERRALLGIRSVTSSARASTFTARPSRRRSERSTCCSSGAWKPQTITRPACIHSGMRSRVSRMTLPWHSREQSTPSRGASSRAPFPPATRAVGTARPKLARAVSGKGRVKGVMDNGGLFNSLTSMACSAQPVSLSPGRDKEKEVVRQA